jgi:gentisate 1,2-dioxygenase
MAPLGLKPLWEVLGALVPREPAVRTQPAHWRWQDVAPFLQASGRAISAAEAVRRVLILENPGWAGRSRATSTLYAGLQLILPGEVAPSHRHAQSALRFVISGSGAYTAVNGQRAAMQPGDFILTPAGTWHEHGNPGTEPVVWLDGLDIPLLELMESGYAEEAHEGKEPTEPPGPGPAAPQVPFAHVHFPYAPARAALAQQMQHGHPHPHLGFVHRYTDPATGGPPLPAIDATLTGLPAGLATSPWRSTAGAVVSVVEGQATLRLQHGTKVTEFDLSPRDHAVLPPWHWCSLHAQRPTVLFSFSDAPLQRALGCLREEFQPERARHG